jgi:gluconokinase
LAAASDQRNNSPGPTVVVVLGVAGSGKTEIGCLLAAALKWDFRDADSYHSAANIEKMSQGQSLSDEDRVPWLKLMAQEIDTWVETGSKTVLACSALKDSYRQALKHGHKEVTFVYLKGSFEMIYARLSQRHGHFMKAEMLASQFAALEEPKDAIVVDAGWQPSKIVAFLEKQLGVGAQDAH